MFMSNLAKLYRTMKAAGRTMEQFRFTLKGVVLDVIFSIRTEPFELLIGIKSLNFFFMIPVRKGFKVGLLDNNTFYGLKKLLNFEKVGKQFTSFDFLRELNSHAPSHVSAKPIQPHEYYAMLPPEQRHQVEEADKIYFVGWNYHLTDRRTARNFKKTLLMTGSPAISEFCRAHNISSMWSDKPRDSKAFTFPSGFGKGV